MNKQTVAVFFGSRSAEHDVSIVTAISSVIKPLQMTKKYDVLPVYIAKDGRWFAGEALGSIDLFRSGKINEYMAKHKPTLLELGDGLCLVRPSLRNIRTKIDVAFPATHGTHGEDGELMALFELANIPYVGCDMPASVLSMDKVLSKIIVEKAELPTPKYEWFYSADFSMNPEPILHVLKSLRYPLFVKPPHLGSSIGISRVANETELINAIEVAMHYDNKVLVEEGVPNLIEVTVPIMGNKKPYPAIVEQPLTNSEDFFDFNTKYIRQGGKKTGGKGKAGAQGYSKIPADISKALYEKAEDTAVAVYKALGCSGIARIDLLIDSKSKNLYFNEVNPLPGSLYAHNWRAAGVSGVQLVEDLVEYALQRYAEKRQLDTVFNTNFLQQF